MKRQIEIFLRSLLIALFVFNAIIPSVAAAEVMQTAEKLSSLKPEALEAASRLSQLQQKNIPQGLQTNLWAPGAWASNFPVQTSNNPLSFQAGAPSALGLIASQPGATGPGQNFANLLSGFDVLETSTAEPLLTDLPASPEVLPTLTDEPTATPTLEIVPSAMLATTATQTEPPTPTITATAAVSPTVTATATAQITVTTQVTATPTVTDAPISPVSSLAFSLSASPAQVAPGDEVTFTIQVQNNDKRPVTGLTFSSTIPEQFGNGQNGLKGFSFDPKTRLLTWDGSEKPGEASNGKLETATVKKVSLAAGETLTLQYTLRLDQNIESSEINTTAILLADGLMESLVAKTLVSVLADGNRLTVLGAKGARLRV